MTNKINYVAGLFDCFAYESITVGTTAVGLTTSVYKSDTGTAARAIITVETDQVRYRYDGTSPTSTEGHLLNATDTLLVVGRGNLDRIRFIRAGADDATIRVSYEK